MKLRLKSTFIYLALASCFVAATDFVDIFGDFDDGTFPTHTDQSIDGNYSDDDIVESSGPQRDRSDSDPIAIGSWVSPISEAEVNFQESLGFHSASCRNKANFFALLEITNTYLTLVKMGEIIDKLPDKSRSLCDFKNSLVIWLSMYEEELEQELSKTSTDTP